MTVSGDPTSRRLVVDAPVALLQDRIDVGSCRGVRLGDVNVATQHRATWPAVRSDRPPIQVELLDEHGVGGVLGREPTVAEATGPFDGDVVRPGDPDLRPMARQWRDRARHDLERLDLKPSPPPRPTTHARRGSSPPNASRATRCGNRTARTRAPNLRWRTSRRSARRRTRSACRSARPAATDGRTGRAGPSRQASDPSLH